MAVPVNSLFMFSRSSNSIYRSLSRLKLFSKQVNLHCCGSFSGRTNMYSINIAKIVPCRSVNKQPLSSVCNNRLGFHTKWLSSSSRASTTECSKNRHFKGQSYEENAVKSTLREAKRKAVELKENIVTIPNVLCLVRMAATPVLGYLVLKEAYSLSLGIFIFAGFTDVIDGYIARTFPSQQSMIGSFLDPAADKLLIATLFLTLTVNGLIPVLLTSIIVLRDACLMSAGFYIRYVSLPSPKTLIRYFDASFATARLQPTAISKVNTMVQLSLVALSLAAPVFGYVDHMSLKLLWGITSATTVLSAGSYLYYKDTYKLLTSRVKRKKNISERS